MINEQIKKEIEKIVDEKFSDKLKKIADALEIFSLPMKSEYRIFCFFGDTTGLANLTPAFDINQILNRYLIIKSFKLDYYVDGDQIDQIALFDGATANRETSGQLTRINRVFDIYDQSMLIDMRINGVPIAMFNAVAGFSYPADLFVDNIYYKYPEKINQWTLGVAGSLMDTPSVDVGQNAVTVSVKATIECYIL